MRPRDFIDSDYPDIDRSAPEPSADDGISSGRGMLASMMTWIRGIGSRSSDVAAAVAQRPLTAHGLTSTAQPYVPINSSGPDGAFDAAELMRGILAYHERHRARLYGAGLIVGLDNGLPSPAFPEVAAMPGFTGAVDTLSLMASDYEDLDAAHRTIKEVLFQAPQLRDMAPRQVAWLINATCVRGAIAMSGFALGRPEIVLDAADTPARSRGARMRFHSAPGQAHAGSTLEFSGIDNPLGLGRLARARLADHCLHAFREAGRAVVGEFLAEVCAAARLGEPDDYHKGVTQMALSSAALGRLSRCYVAFSNLTGMVAADKAFQATLSRQAMVDALRHGTYGFQLAPYLAHTKASVQADVLAYRHHGSLALGHYSLDTLLELANGHCSRIAVTANYSPFSGSLQVVSDEPGQAPAGAALSARTFLRAMAAELSAPARTVLESASPRYLAPLVLGLASASPVTESEELLGAHERQESAGRRLGRAFTELLSESPSPAKLPWLRVLACGTSKALMVEGEDDEAATRGLVTLFRLANALRAKSLPQSELDRVPEASAFIDAPESASVGSILRLMGIAPSTLGSLERTADAVLAELLSSMPVTAVAREPGADLEAAQLKWEPVLAGFRPMDSGAHDELEVAFRVAGSRRERWCRLVLASDSSGTYPEEFGPLQMGVGTPDNAFGRVFDAKRALKRDETALPVRTLRGEQFANPAVKAPPATKLDSPAVNTSNANVLAEALTTHFEGLTRTRPLEMAALFVSVAEHFRHAGIDAFERVQPIGRTKTFRLARASVARDNPAGLGLVVALSKDPFARTAAGTSLLDIALELGDADGAGMALKALANHPVSTERLSEVTEMVQRALGKLIERHPSLLPQAMHLGAVADDIAMAAWDAQHPSLKTAESRAAMNAAAMAASIARSRARHAAESSSAPSESAPRRRRMGV
jgi:hypothetical protein